jgi:chromosome segregation ATPase
VKFTFAILFAALLVSACNRNEPRSTQAASEDRGNATDQMKAERDNYVKGVDARLSEMDQKIDGLNERAGAMTNASKADFKTSIDNLRDQRKAVASKLDDLKSVSVESWMTLKAEVDSAMEGLEHSYEQVSNRFQNVPGPATSRPTHK